MRRHFMDKQIELPSSEALLLKPKFNIAEESSDAFVTRRLLKRKEAIDEINWIKREIEYMEFHTRYKTRYEIKKGEVYLFDFGVDTNNEVSSINYGVVLKNSSIYNPQVLVCPLKEGHSGDRLKTYELAIGLLEGHINLSSYKASVSQIRTIDKIRMIPINKISNRLNERTFPYNFNDEDVLIPYIKEDKVSLILKAYIAYITGM